MTKTTESNPLNANKYNANVVNLLKENIQSLEDLKEKCDLQFAGKVKLLTFNEILKKAKKQRSYFE